MSEQTRRGLVTLAAILAAATAVPLRAEVIGREAKATLTALEMDHGDELRFRLRGGRVVSLLLDATEAAVVEEVKPGGIVYRFSAQVRIDGQSMQLQRCVCCQECFYEPWVVNGLRIWLDTVRDVFDVIPVRYPRKGNLQCVPRKAARFAVQDATLRICPDQVLPWIEDDGPTLDVGKCYNGDDCYLGPYLGQACHVGMDINHAKGSLLFAPIRFDTQAYFNSLTAGDNNNRWRGIRRWPNGDVWALQTHHLIKLLVPENTSLQPGVKYATTAGVHVGSHEHTHFEFKIGSPRDAEIDDPTSIAAPIDFDDESELAQEQPEVLHLDPWILFWQSFEDQKENRGEVQASMRPFAPARAGEAIHFSAAGSRPGPNGKSTTYFWFFGDTGTAKGPMPTHVFPRPGVFPVRLIVDDGIDRDSATQWISITGVPAPHPFLTLNSRDEPFFCPRLGNSEKRYGQSTPDPPYTLRFVARASRPKPAMKTIHLGTTIGDQYLKLAPVPFTYEKGADWLRVTRERRSRELWLEVRVDATGMESGTYSASLPVRCPGTPPETPYNCRVELYIPSTPPKANVTVDDADPGFYATPGFWVGHRFCRCPEDRRGYAGFYLTNGSRVAAGEFARFTPDLQAGKYDVSLSDETPFSPGVEFDVRVRHAEGNKTVRVRPEESRKIGTFEFDEGADGFVEILAKRSKGLIIADAVVFRKR